MPSNKVNKYMKQYEERNYAPKARKVTKSDLAEYINRSEGRQAAEASSGDSAEQSREEKEVTIPCYGKVVVVTEEVVFIGEQNEESRKEDVGKAHKQRRQRVPRSDQGRCEAEESRPVRKTKCKKK